MTGTWSDWQGGGLQIRTAKLDAAGDIDIVAAGKEGTKIVYNTRK